MNKNMEAAVHYEYGNESVLQVKTIPIPNFSQNEILVKVKAATVNRTDCAYLTGKPAIMHLIAGFKKPRNSITGSDFAGVVMTVGEAVTKLKTGDRVVGLDANQLS
ncbi:MAG: alcohol dehydrogenase catalytic domain-containing protein [Gracilimonas sp.]|jgi:NADPH:quinone reductase-like Zn-dependent oxidoreductase|nr:alcohol dehydrogenase catalytic domain-containing protein [Gracilimonas sp.]